jgi:exodeoxyribonuclease VII small subunit
MKDQDNTPGSESQQLSFDAILGQLQQLVERLESNELSLEESIRTFEQGINLSRQGQQILDTAERRVEVLLRDGSTKPVDA